MSCCRLTTGNILQAIAESMKLDTSEDRDVEITYRDWFWALAAPMNVESTRTVRKYWDLMIDTGIFRQESEGLCTVSMSTIREGMSDRPLITPSDAISQVRWYHPEGFTARMVIDRYGVNPANTTRRLKQLCDRGVLKREIRDGVYFYTGARRSTTT